MYCYWILYSPLSQTAFYLQDEIRRSFLFLGKAFASSTASVLKHQNLNKEQRDIVRGTLQLITCSKLKSRNTAMLLILNQMSTRKELQKIVPGIPEQNICTKSKDQCFGYFSPNFRSRSISKSCLLAFLFCNIIIPIRPFFCQKQSIKFHAQ